MATPVKVQTDTKASDAVIARLHSLHPKIIDLSLDRIKVILARLGNPHLSVPPTIHVAGTNGKGSTTAIIRSISEAAGYRVHTYTSPHLVRFHERIRLAGQLITEEQLTDLLNEVEVAAAGDPITFFEVTTAAAFLAFSRIPADLLVLEVGLGGRLDATNVIENPVASVITPIDLDHQQFLGDTIADIAAEKAGIIKQSGTAIIAPQKTAAMSVIRRACKDQNAKLFEFGEQWQSAISDDKSHMVYEDYYGKLTLPLPALTGPHQIVNAGMAIAALREQKALSIPEAAIHAGLGWVIWPARLQNLSRSTLGKHAPNGSQIILDGGHNPAASQTVYEFLKEYDPVSEPIWLVLGIMARKDIKGFIKPLAGLLGARVIALPIDSQSGAAPAAEIASAATDAGMNGRMARDILGAFEIITAETLAGETPTILIGGSLYLAGEILKEIGWSIK